MNFTPIKPDTIRYEMRMVSGEDPFAQQQKTPGAFGRFLSGLGRFFGAVTLPMSLIFPPAAIGAAGMYGIGQIGDQMQYKAYQKMMQNQSSMQFISYPGLDLSSSASQGMNMSMRDENVMNVLFARNDMMLESAHKI